MDIGNLDFKNGSVNPSGIVPIAYRIRRDYISAFPTIVDTPDEETTVAQYASYAGDFVLVAAKKWEKIYSTQGKGKVFFEPVGETDSRMYMNKGTLSFPDLTDEARAYAKDAANGDYVYIIPTPNKRYHLLGSPDYRVTSSISGDSGDAPGSAKGLTIALECPDVTPLPRYAGALILSDGELDCDTGIFTPTAG